MKCRTVKQPWATLLVHGATQYLVSTWRTFYRGPVAIHASARFPRSHVELCCEADMRRLLRRTGYDYVIELPMQAVLGTVTVADCLRVSEQNREIFDPEDPTVVFGLVQPDRWVWVCSGHVVFAQPVPLVGRLGLFTIPDGIAADSGRED
jgi:activating signal cointegrator 1